MADDAEEFKEECNFPSCNKNAVNSCKYCSRSFCETHFKPKHTASRNYIHGLKDPELIKIYEEDERDNNGHPDPHYQEWWDKEYEAEREKLRAQNLSMWDTMTALKGWISKEREASSDYNRCYAQSCDNVAIRYCSACKKRYCKYHSLSRKISIVDHLGGHVCNSPLR